MNNDILQTLKQIATPTFLNSAQATGGTISIIKSTGGSLHVINVGGQSFPSLTIYDNASGASGSIVASFQADPETGTYVYDVTFVSGLTMYAALGNNFQLNISYR